MGRRKMKLSDIPMPQKRPTFKVTNREGREITPGTAVTSFRGEVDIFRGVSREPVGHKEAKVTMEDRPGEYYASVYGLTVEIVSEKGTS